MGLCFGVGLAPRVITKLLKIPISLLKKNEHQSDNIFGRYVDLESYNTRISHESRHSHISPAELGLCSKYNKINFVPMSENRIFGNGDRFNQNDFVIDDHRRYKKLSKLVRTFSVVILQLFWN